MDAELERVGDVRLDREEDLLSFGCRIDLFESQDRAPGGDPKAIGNERIGPGQPDGGLAVRDGPAEALGVEAIEGETGIEQGVLVAPRIVEQPRSGSRRR